jgi:hypothetical protein
MNRRPEILFVRKTAIANFAIVLLLVFSPVLTFAIQHSGEWIKYNSKEGGYTVLLPGQPSVDSQEATSASGEKFTQYKATVSSGKVIYMIGYFDYPPGTVFDFDAARDRMMDGVKATLLGERSMSVGGAPGREIRLLMKISGDDYLMVARFYDVDQRVYVIQFIAPKSDEARVEEKAARYFDSFQVVKTPQ